MLRKLLLLSSLALLMWADAHILVYHRFADPRYPSTNTSLKELERTFRHLKERGYRVIPLQRLIKALENDEPIDDRWVVITIDDGFRSFLNALPLFQKYGYPFTIFIATEPIERGYPDYLSWSDLRQIAAYGEIALHSHSHKHLCDLDDEEIWQDTQKAMKLFKRRLGFEPEAYAYPYGEYDPRVKSLIGSFGFKAICNQNRGAINQKSDPLDLDRIAMVGRSDLEAALKIERLDAEWIEPKVYPKDTILRRILVKIPPHYHEAWIYITGYGWRAVRVQKGLIDTALDLPLEKKRVRVIIKVKDSKINTKILVRSRYGAK